jgi:SCY1-like protein 2
MQEASVFLFDKRTADKLHKPRRKETISEMLRHGVRQLERCRHPRLLHVLHSVEETSDTLAFATEPVSTSLGNVLAALEDEVQQQQQQPSAGSSSSGGNSILTVAETHNGSRRNSAREIRPPEVQQFLDIEIKYGIYQVILILIELI